MSIFKNIQIILKKIYRSFIKEPNNFIRIISRQVAFLIEFPKFYSKAILNIIFSIFSSLMNKRSIKQEIIRKINGKISFLFNFQLDHRIFGYYIGNHQLDVIKILFRYLRKGGTFIDVGCNIGLMSAIGASIVGKKGQVHCFEPVPNICKHIFILKNLNRKYQFFVNNIGLGERNETLKIEIHNTLNIGDNTMVPGLYRENQIKEHIQVPVKRLDDYLIENKIKNISLIKIDVEGFEFPVLKGLSNFFERQKENLPPIIVEITPSAFNHLGYKLKDLQTFMEKYSYKVIL